MTASELKKSIFQMAVEGKLTEQNKKDEPVEKLLKRIKEEKEKLIKEGKIKKDKTTSEIYKKDGSYYERIAEGKNILKEVCIDEELPFDIPDSWAWVRLGNIGKIVGGSTPKSENPMYYTSSGNGIPWITPADMKNINGIYISHGRRDITEEGYKSCSTFIIPKNSIIFSSRAPIGYVAISNNELCTNQGFKSIVPYISDINFSLLYYYFLQYKTKSIESRASGTTFKEVSGSFLEKELFPLPPIEEQKRIAEKINLLMPLINEYDSLEKNITKLNKEFPNSIKKSILQYAIEGKLTEQSEKDEPVEKLLKRIKEEKENLIKEGKIKKEKTTSEIYKKDGSYYERITDGKNILKDVCIDDELPFEIPDSWCWCNVSDIANIYTGNSINENEKKTKYMGVTSGYCYIATKDVGFDNIINYDNGVKIPNTDNKFRIAPKNSVLLCIEGGSAGKKISVTDKDVCFGNKLCCFSTIRVNVFFLYYYLQSPVFNLIFKENINGIIGGVSINKLKQLKIPLPPIEEQKRIVDKINRVNEVINTIKI
ncbi:restriction endonuclease subunit S [Brachyspira pilosicoli]